MKAFIPKLPFGITAAVRGQLYWTESVAERGEDMLEVSFLIGIPQSSVLVTAGWIPEGSANGAYEIAVTRGLELVASVSTTSFIEAQNLLQQAVWSVAFGQNMSQMVSSSSSNFYTMPQHQYI